MNPFKKLLLLFVILFYANNSFSQVTFTVPSQICSREVYTLTAQHGTTSAFWYNWTVTPAGAAISHSMLAKTLMIFFTDTVRVFTVSVLVSLTSGTALATQVVTVYPNPTVQITPSSPTVCPGGIAILTASGANQYTWMPGGAQGTINGVFAGTHTLTGMSAGCTATAEVTITEVLCTDLKDIRQADYKIYPNPVSNTLFLDHFSDGIQKIEVTESNGKHVEVIVTRTSADQQSIDLSHLKNGIYFLFITEQDNSQRVLKFIKTDN